MICKLLVILLFSVTHVLAVITRHAIVFTDGKTDDILAHQVLEARGEYNSIHFISEGVENHELVHRSIQTGRKFYRARTQAFHYNGHNVLKQAVPHEATYLTMPSDLATAPKPIYNFEDLAQHLLMHDDHHIDIFQHAPTSADDVETILRMFPGQVKLYHLVHGYNSSQDNESRHDPTPETLKFVTELQSRVKFYNREALFVATAGSSSFKSPSDGVTVFMEPLKNSIPRFHREITLKDDFYARQIEAVLDKLGQGIPPDIEESGGLQALVERARIDDKSSECLKARSRGAMYVKELISGLKNNKMEGSVLHSRLVSSVLSAFTEGRKIEACDAMHVVHVLEQRSNPEIFPDFHFVQKEKGAKIVIKHGKDKKGTEHGKTLFGLDEKKTAEKLLEVFDASPRSRPRTSGGMQGSSSSAGTSSKKARQGERHLEKREDGPIRHAIVFTDGNVDDIMAHQVLEKRGNYDYIHFISEGVANHELAHRSIQTGRLFYRAQTPAYNYVGSNVFEEAAPHEYVFQDLEKGLRNLPRGSTFKYLDCGLVTLERTFVGSLREDLHRRLPREKTHRIDIFQHAPTPANDMNYILDLFPGQVDRYHLVHGYNSAQDKESREKPTRTTKRFLSGLQVRVKNHNRHALFVAMGGSSSFNEPTDGPTVFMAPFKDLVPKFHIEATTEDLFYARQIGEAQDIVEGSAPDYVKDGFRNNLRGLFKTARGSEDTPSRTAARISGKKLVERLMGKIKDINVHGQHDGLISRLERLVIKAFVEDCRIEGGEAMHTLHALKNGYEEDSYDKFRFHQIAENAEIMVEQVHPDEIHYHGRSLFGLSQQLTVEDLKQVLRESLPSQSNIHNKSSGSSSPHASSSNKGIRQYKKRDLDKKVALALDIDGVLKHGDTVLPGAKDAIRRLVEKKIPFILLRNGGGVSEEDRAEKLSKQLEAVISPESLILGRTPMKALAQKHADDPVLVTGTNGGHSKILKDYGFQRVYTVAEVQQWNERIFPFSKLRKEQFTNSLSINGEDIVFKAFFFLQESDDWGRDMQYAIDVMSPPYGSIVAGKPKAGSAEEPLHEKDRPKLYYASADLLTPTEGISRPRLGMGAIKLSLESIYDKLFYPSTGQRLEEMTVTYGKPSKMTYEYASKVFKEEHGVEKDDYTIWMIGDNPDVDIKGANRAGWKSALVKTGVYQKNEMPTEEPTLFVDNVLEAVDKILALHPTA